MAAVLTAAEMRALEQAAIASGDVTGLELMERAGRGVVEAILAEWPDIEAGARRAVVLCGPGNNGGDGFVVARLLRERGWEVEAFLYGDAERLPPDARANHDRFARGGVIAALDLKDAHGLMPEDLAQPDLWIDALLGIGLNRPLDPALNGFLGDLAISFDTVPGRSAGRLVALDVPTGLDADTGLPRVLGQDGRPRQAIGHGGIAYKADLTITFHSLKPGHLLAQGPSICGRTRVGGLGLADRRPGHRVWDDLPWTRGLLAKRTGHKFTHGHALLLSGRPGHGGAARLAARASLRIGAGLVTLAVPPAALQENAARLDAVMLRPVRDAAALTTLLSDPRLNALCAGPGLGTTDREAALLHALLDAKEGQGDPQAPPAPPRKLVLDADALTLIAKDDTLRAKLHDRVVLTPHEGEFARLFPAIDAKWRAPATTGPAFSKVDAAREAAREAGCVVLLKGPDTVIADPQGRAAINAAVYDRAAPWLATAGSGDVLAGMICGLLARGFPPFDAASTAAWLHVEAARSFGPGLIAEDLPDELPKVFRALGL